MPIVYAKFEPRMTLQDVYERLDLVAIQCYHPFRYGAHVITCRRVDVKRAVIDYMKLRFSDTYMTTIGEVLQLSKGDVMYNGDGDMNSVHLMFDRTVMDKGGLIVNANSVFAFRRTTDNDDRAIAYAVRFQISTLKLYTGV